MYVLPDVWTSQLGHQRDWIWRGWRVRYTYLRSSAPQSEATGADSLPILLIHGFGSALTQWRMNLASLSQSHPVYALDLVGFGASEKAAAPYRVEFWAEQVYEFWQTFINRPVLLVGHSLGALVALGTATTYPQLVSGLVLMTLPASRQELLPRWAYPIASSIESVFARSWVVRPLFQLVRQPRLIRAALKLAYTDPNLITDELIASYVAPTADRGAAQTLIRLSKAATRPDYTPNTQLLLAKLQQPTLILWGTEDRIVRLANRRDALKSQPRLKLVEIPNAGHCAYEECAEQVNQEILEWAAQLEVYPSA